MDIAKFLNEIMQDQDYKDQVVHIEDIPGSSAVYGEFEEPLPEPIQMMLERQGIQSLYTHQVDSIKAVRNGESIVVVTSAASGKTLCYTIPILEEALTDPEMTALYLFPTKALAQDQYRRLREQQGIFNEINPPLSPFGKGGNTVDFGKGGSYPVIGTYDGDTPNSLRKKVQAEARVILTNPDMLHVNIMPGHIRWNRFFQNLRYVVIDELHTYRGIFGSHCAHVFRRLNRICRHYGANPQFICCSATIGNPLEHAEKLTGKKMTLINNDGAPHAPKKFILWNPAITDPATLQRRSGNVEAVELMTRLIQKGIRTIAFTKNWGSTELVHRYCRDSLLRISPRLADTVGSYRAGYLPQERREIERKLFSGELLGVASTIALELGIDIGGLDACIIIGYPGTISGTWQQAGRAGRGNEEAIVILVGYDTPINQYIMNHPNYIFDKPHEVALIVPDNYYVLSGQLACASFELPLKDAELEEYGENAMPIMNILEKEGVVYRSKDVWYYTGQNNPAYEVSLRNITSHSYTIVDVSSNNKVIGTIDQISAYPTAHPEAIYYHNGESYYVENLDLERKMAIVRKVDTDYYTNPLGGRGVKTVDSVEHEKPLPGKGNVFFGEVTAEFNTLAYQKIRLWTREVFDEKPVNLPPQTLETIAYCLVPLDETIMRMKSAGRMAYEGVYGLGQALMVTTALFAHCYPLDVRYSPGWECITPGIPNNAIFIFDNYQGGLGFTEYAYEAINDILQATLKMIAECECEDGCPSCVGFYLRSFIPHDPENWEGYLPDKEGALMLLHDYLGLEPYVPKPLSERAKTWRQRVAMQMQERKKRAQDVPIPDSVKPEMEKILDGKMKL
jgi:DEAD/DEAH box helicase domain-containing protein